MINMNEIKELLLITYKNKLKRCFDLFTALFVLLISWPILLFIAIAIKLTSFGPIFFIQERIGKQGKKFKIYKFRTMIDKERIVNREILIGDSEVTWFGSILRRYKLDELPQLINVLKGDVSIVGPRPILPEMIDSLDDVGIIRLKVTPGLTGLSQINGNIYLSWKDRWKYDKCYVDNISFFLDLKIVIKTIFIIIVGEEKFLIKPE